jgi:RNA polymerase sigma-32 factor
MQARVAARDFSLDAKVDDDGRQSYLDFLAASSADPEVTVATAEYEGLCRTWLAKAEAELDERERYILENRIKTEEPEPLWQVGQRFNISRERVRQLEAIILGKLRAALTGHEVATLAAA